MLMTPLTLRADIGMTMLWPAAADAQTTAPSLRLDGRVVLSEVKVELTTAQVEGLLLAVQHITIGDPLERYGHLRPAMRARAGPRAWWMYALRAVQQDLSEERERVSWRSLQLSSQMQRRYEHVLFKALTSSSSRWSPLASVMKGR